jgi:predicted NodU family carbamoyl transferase
MTPEHAVETFAKTKMDLLVLGNLVVRRNGR